MGYGGLWHNRADLERAMRRAEQLDRERAERAKQPSIESRADRVRRNAEALKAQLERLKMKRR